MKTKIIFILILSVSLLNSCAYINQTYIEKSPEEVKKAATNMLSKTGYKYKIVSDENSSINLIKFNRFMSEIGNIFVVPEQDNKTGVLIIFTTGNFNDASWIFTDTLIQELAIMDTNVELKSNLEKKDINKFLLLTTLNSGFGLYYEMSENPYYSKAERNLFSTFFGLIEIPYYYLLIAQPSKDENTNLKTDKTKREDITLGLAGLIVFKGVAYLGGLLDIKLYNDLVDSGYFISKDKNFEDTIKIPFYYKKF